MKSEIHILLDYAAGKGLKFLKDEVILDLIGMHDFLKSMDYIYHLAKKDGNQEVISLCEKHSLNLKEVYSDMNLICKEYNEREAILKKVKRIESDYDQIRYACENIVDNGKGINVILNLHELEKDASSLTNTANSQDLSKISELSNRLENSLDDVYKIISGKSIIRIS